MAKPTSKAARLAELAGAPPKMATVDDLQAAGANRHGRAHAVHTSSAHKRNLGINLLAVAEALAEEGLDPALEFARVLKGRPEVDADGNPLVDPTTGHQVRKFDIDPDTRVRMLSEILQYTQPKLKAVEVKLNGALELSNEQLDQRLEALLAKATQN